MARSYGYPASCFLLALVSSALVVLGAMGCGSSSDPTKAASSSTGATAEAHTASVAAATPAPGKEILGHGPPNPMGPGEYIDKQHDNAIHTSAIPRGQSVRGDGDADNPSDMDGNGDADATGDNDNDNPTPESYRFPDSDDRAVFAYGHPASTSQTKTITGVVTRYFAAAARAEGAVACPLLVPTLVRTLFEAFAGEKQSSSYLHAGESCARIMSALFVHHRAQFAEAVHVVEVRVEGHNAQVIVASRTMPAGEVLLQGGPRWTIEQLFPGTLP